MSSMIPECTADTDADAMYAILMDAGCLVVRDMASPEGIAAVRAELADFMAAAPVVPHEPEDFYSGNTRRAVGLMSRSPTMRELMMHPAVERLCDRHLLPNCSRYHVNVTAALEVGPDARDQILHREEDLFPYLTVADIKALFGPGHF
ncbi:MAG: phytanoyl-CoA dioxygenase family protein [Candidatus Binatia bacterium]|nr:phytanoyl-CoA dioxygenase family protein [Candidatus Binatia bacterium]MDG2010699.1 phytanoyl-CoA dioxygenase family protein [Candidatus Binatia bacterium]